MSVPIGAGVIIQSLYLMIDLFFVSRLGSDAVAGVTSTATATLLVGMFGQMLGVGAVSLIGRALGAGCDAQARIIFIHAGLMAFTSCAVVIIAGYMGGIHVLSGLASGEVAQRMGSSYLYGCMPGLALQIVITVATYGLRAAGEPYGGLIAQCCSVPVNLILAPLLIFGVPGINGLGTFGAGLATTLATTVATAIVLYRALKRYRHFSPMKKSFHWESAVAWRIVSVGLPAGLEAFVIYLYTGLMYWACTLLGTLEQAAVGIGLMIIQVAFIPSVSVAYGCVPVAAYYFGAHDIGKVKEIYVVSLVMVSSVLLCLTMGCLLWGVNLVSLFSSDGGVTDKATYVLMYLGLNFLMSGLTHFNGSILQASGNTIWALLAICIRLSIFVVPLLLLIDFDQLTLKWLCLLSNFAFFSQAIVSSFAVHVVIKTVQAPAVLTLTGVPEFKSLSRRKEG